MTEKTYSRIMEAAEKLFQSYGLKKVSVDDIAKEAGINRKTVYNAFSGKEEIYAKIIESKLQTMKDKIMEIDGEQIPFIDKIIKVVCELLEIRKKNPFISKMYTDLNLLRSEEGNYYINEFEKLVQNYISEKLKEAIDKKVIRKVNINNMTYIIYKLYFAIIFDKETNLDIDENDLKQDLSNILEHGLLL